MKIKICGIRDLETALLCEKLGADALGYIFYNNSKRFVSAEKCQYINSKLSPFTLKVGVFVNSSVEEINRIAKLTKINLAQLHLHNDYSNINKLDIPHLRVYRVNDDFDYETINPDHISLLDYFDNISFGGSGVSWDWNRIPNKLRSKIIIAGGISKENIENIFIRIRPYGIDLSSSLEDQMGNKSKDKIISFFNTVNQLRSYKC